VRGVHEGVTPEPATLVVRNGLRGGATFPGRNLGHVWRAVKGTSFVKKKRLQPETRPTEPGAIEGDSFWARLGMCQKVGQELPEGVRFVGWRWKGGGKS